MYFGFAGAMKVLPAFPIKPKSSRRPSSRQDNHPPDSTNENTYLVPDTQVLRIFTENFVRAICQTGVRIIAHFCIMFCSSQFAKQMFGLGREGGRATTLLTRRTWRPQDAEAQEMIQIGDFQVRIFSIPLDPSFRPRTQECDCCKHGHRFHICIHFFMFFFFDFYCSVVAVPLRTVCKLLFRAIFTWRRSLSPLEF